MRYCILENCDRKHHAFNYCEMHYNRYLKNGTENIDRPIKSKQEFCKVLECKKIHVAKGYCSKHYQRRNKIKKLTGSDNAKNKTNKIPNRESRTD